jgi:prepilin-type processing-associated H-X9-DG protein
MAEVKAYQSFLGSAANPSVLGAPAPITPADAMAYGGSLRETGHTEWVDFKVHETGFTAVFPPNTKAQYTTGGTTHDVDFISNPEGKSATIPTYAAVTSRSYHTGGVNVLLMDGSVRFVRDTIPQATWRALATRAGGEVNSE